ncbi:MULTISPECIES: hypothetical protein [unclassified Phyllobacterium]|uniref:hypothetical protein n=1 Tax=unclassified Phyllobacterium TaxID=2638441 RepID=UPI003012DAC1
MKRVNQGGRLSPHVEAKHLTAYKYNMDCSICRLSKRVENQGKDVEDLISVRLIFTG